MEGLKSLWKYGSWKTKAMVLGVLMMETVPTVLGKNNKSAEETDQENNLSPKTEEVIDENVIGEASNIGKKANHAISADDLLALADPEAKKNKKKKKNKNQEENNNQATKTKRTQTETRPAPRTLAEKNEYLNKVIYPKLTTLRLQTAWPGYSEAEKAKAREELEKFREENKEAWQHKTSIYDIELKHSTPGVQPSPEATINKLLYGELNSISILTNDIIHKTLEGESQQGLGQGILYVNERRSKNLLLFLKSKIQQLIKRWGLELKVFENEKHVALGLDIRKSENGKQGRYEIAENCNNYYFHMLFIATDGNGKIYFGIYSLNKDDETSLSFFSENEQEQIEQYYLNLGGPKKELWGVPKKK